MKTLILLLLAACASAAPVTFSGTFTSDDDQWRLDFTLSAPSVLDARTTSYATGGFDPFLSLFDRNGLQLLLAVNEDDLVCPPDPSSGVCLDSAIQFSLDAGDYALILTQSGNFPIGPTLSDGFTQTGSGNFTGGPFLDILGNLRSGDFRVVVDGTEIPEPSTAVPLLFLAAGYAGHRLRLSRARRPSEAPSILEPMA